MAFFRKKVGKQGTWPQAIGLLLAPILVILCIRWLLFEPFVIPSGSMKPNLLINDHLLVKKYSYGIRWPFSDGWILRYAQPHRGDVVVFRYPVNPKVFYIKRVIGLPGDKIQVQNGQITVNSKPWVLRPMLPDESVAVDEETEFNYFLETIPWEQSRLAESGNKKLQALKKAQAKKNKLKSADDILAEHEQRFKEMIEQDFKRKQLESESLDVVIRLFANKAHIDPSMKEFTVPPNSYFVMGDNRDESQDSRSWGFVPARLLIGEAGTIWLSCESMLDSAPMLCDPDTLRLNRMFKKVE